MEKAVNNCTICNRIGQNRCPEHVVVDHFEQKFHEYIYSDDVFGHNFDEYTTQCSQYKRKFTHNELASYFYKEYYQVDYPDNEVMLIHVPATTIIKNITTGEITQVEGTRGLTAINVGDSRLSTDDDDGCSDDEMWQSEMHGY